MGKVGLVWTGFFAGISLGDWVLLATLTYTVIQIILTIVERVIRPIMAARAAKKARANNVSLNSQPEN